MLRALALSIGQLGDRAILAVLARSLALTLVILIVAGIAIVAGVRMALADGFALGEGWADLGAALAGIGTVLAGWLLFRIVAIAVMGLFADGVVAAVEARHYPEAARMVRPVPVGRAAAMALGSALRALAVNALLLPLYPLLLLTGVGAPLLFGIANSWLLGRDLGDMVAARHLPPGAMTAWRRQTRLSRLSLGGIGTAMLLVPIAGLLGPLLGAAMATHLFHQGKP